MNALMALILGLTLSVDAAAAQQGGDLGDRATAPTAFPSPDDLPSIKELPDPLVNLDGTRVTTREQWETRRKPELQALFQHYIYGALPPPPKGALILRSVHRDALAGKATIKQIGIPLGTADGATLELLLVIPNERKLSGGAPVIFGINFSGNHGVLADPRIALTTKRLGKSPSYGIPENHATEAGRGLAAKMWTIEQSIARGVAVATFVNSDIGLGDGTALDPVIAYYYHKSGQVPRGDGDWGAIAAWAWGMQRAVDYLVTDPEINPKQLIAYGHSRNGKAALLATATDPRIAAVIAHQSGCGGAAPSRRHNLKGETVKDITKFSWFSPRFKEFAEREDRLPIDQHELIALCAPRPLLLSNGTLDQWASPDDQFNALMAALPVYQLYGIQNLPSVAPAPGERVGEQVAATMRIAAHGVDALDWKAFLDWLPCAKIAVAPSTSSSPDKTSILEVATPAKNTK